MTLENTSTQDSSQDWTFKTEEEIASISNPIITLQDSTTVGNTLISIPSTAPHAVVFHGDSGSEVGKLTFGDGNFKFDGKADESAKAFMTLLKQLSDGYYEGLKSKFINDIRDYLSIFQQ